MDNKFNFTYSAPTDAERQEIESIRREYSRASSGCEDKLTRLRTLNGRVKNNSTAWGLVLGVGGLLIFGLGMSMVLEWSLTAWGIVVAIIGVVPIALAYPVYKMVRARLTKKYGDEIVKLADELLG